VDDQRDVAGTISTVLKKHGYNVETAYDGNECLQKVENGRFRLIFLDIMLPGMSGDAIAKELRKTYDSKIKIVYVTIKPKAEVDITDADGFIQKPFKIREIIREAEVMIA